MKDPVIITSIIISILLSLYLGGVIGWYLKDWYNSNQINKLRDKNIKTTNRCIRITERMKYYKDLNDE